MKREIHQKRGQDQKRCPSNDPTPAQALKTKYHKWVYLVALCDVPPIHKGGQVEEEQDHRRREPKERHHQQRPLVVHTLYPPPHEGKGHLEKKQSVGDRERTHRHPIGRPSHVSSSGT